MWLLRNIRLFKNWYTLYMGGLTLRLRNGLVMHLPTRHDVPILWEVFGDECYGEIKGSVIVDIGANIGSFSLLAALENPTATIHAYEPSAKNYIYLGINAKENGANIRTHKMAVAGSAGTRDFHLAKHGDSGHNSLFPVNEDDQIVQVPCVTLDSILEEIGVVDYLKIDVEGAEREILEASKLLATHVRKVVIEGDENVAELLSAFNVAVPSKGFVIAYNKSI